jgi:signal transduction histidine kinase/ligand-binding sensor domain-containing protein/DNA-binding response OmpR family regulator
MRACWLVWLVILVPYDYLFANEWFELSNPQVSAYQPSFGSIGKIKAIAQGKNDFIWLTTATGLYRYDGFEFKKVTLKGEPDTFDIIIDSSGKLWISTLNKGLYQYDPISGHETIFQKNTADTHSLNDNALSQLHRNGNTLWIASAKGVSAINLLTNQFVALPEVLKKAVNRISIKDILLDNKKQVWLTTFDSGVYVYDQLRNTIKHFNNDNQSSGLTSNKTTRLLEDNNGSIWLGSFDGIFHFNNDLNKFIHLSKTTGMTISSIIQDSNNKIWIGTWENGVIELDTPIDTVQPSTLLLQPNSLKTIKQEQISDIFEDKKKNIWFSSPNTLSKITLRARKLNHLKNPRVAPCYIKGLKQSQDDSIWFSCTKDLYKFKLNKNQEITSHFTTSSEINDIKEDHQGNLWLLFYREDHLLRYNPNNQSSTYFYANKNSGLLGGVVLDLHIDSKGNIWAGTYSGHLPQNLGNLFLFDKSSQRFKKVLKDINILTITEIKPSKLLLTTPQGIFTYDTILGSLALTDPNFYLPQINRVNTVYKDSQNNVWISIFENGIYVYNSKNEKITPFDFLNNKRNKDIASIIEDKDGNIWFSSGQELIKYNKIQKEFYILNNRDGIQINQFMLDAALLSQSGDLMFAGNYSILSFKPAEVFEKVPSPQIKLTDFKLSNNSVKISSESRKTVLSQNITDLKNLYLSYKDYLFSFTFALLSFNSPHVEQYAYKLEGIDKNWINTDSKNRIATYTTIPSGHYTFRYKAQVQGVWHEGSPLKLTVTPPYWLTWQAYSLYLAILILIVYAFIVYRTKSFKKQAINLQQGIQDKTKELEEKSEVIKDLLSQKQRLFVNVSHEFRTPLSLILTPIEVMLLNEKCNKKREHYTLINRNAHRLLRMVEQLLEVSKLDSHYKGKLNSYSLKQTIETIFFAFESAFDEKNIQLTINEFEDKQLQLIEDSLEKIIINLLSNSLKYTNSGGRVSIKVSHKKSHSQVLITDNGIGINPKNHNDIFKRFARFSEDYNKYTPGSGIGLSLVKELVEANEGQISFESELNKGTSFKVILPIVENEKSIHSCNQSYINSDVKLELTALNLSAEELIQNNNLPHLPNILIVEDNIDMRNFLVNNLNEDMNSFGASSGKTGLELAFKHLPDIIISDVMMPEIDGIELVKRLKENELTSHIPIIMLSAKNDLDSRLRGWANRVDEYMPKPFHLSELKLRIKNILSIREILQQRLAKNISQTKPKWHGSNNNKKEQEFIDCFEKSIEENYMNSDFKRNEVASHMAMSERQLNRKLSALFNLGFSEYVQKYRLRKATELLGSGLQVNEICYDVGFNSPSYFSKCFKAEYGKTVKQYEEEYYKKKEETRTKEVT